MADPLVLELGEIAIFDYAIEILSDSYNWRVTRLGTVGSSMSIQRSEVHYSSDFWIPNQSDHSFINSIQALSELILSHRLLRMSTASVLPSGSGNLRIFSSLIRQGNQICCSSLMLNPQSIRKQILVETMASGNCFELFQASN